MNKLKKDFRSSDSTMSNRLNEMFGWFSDLRNRDGSFWRKFCFNHAYITGVQLNLVFFIVFFRQNFLKTESLYQLHK